MVSIGIDLGTTNSLISVFEDGKPRLIKNALGRYLTPSVVHLDKDTLVCGEAAKSRLVTNPETTASVFKRTMGAEKNYKLGKKKFTSEELSAVILASLKRDAETELGHPIKDVIISVPAYFNELQRKAVRAACQIADLNPLRLINEPTAAALAYGLQDLERENTFLVFDLGGGTFDVSILEIFEGVMEVKSSAGDAYLGGEDFTHALMKYFEETLSLTSLKPEQQNILRRVADNAKHELSKKHQLTLTSHIGGQDLNFEISREKFEEITVDLLHRLRRPVERAIYDAGLTVNEIDRVVLVGGATRMPVIRSFVGKLLKKLPEPGLDPDHIVALGAGVQAGLVGKDEALEEVVMTDVSAFTLGVEASEQVGNNYEAGYFLPIIERNTVVPVSREQVVSTVKKGQTHVSVRVFQGEAPRIDSNIFLGKLEVNVPRNFKEHESVAIRFSYDISGLLEVDTRVLSTGEAKNLLIKELAGELSQDEIDAKLKSLEKLKVHPRDMQENIVLLARIEQCYAMARHEDRELIKSMLIEFTRVIEKQNPSEIELLRSQISEELDAFEASYVR